MTSKTPDYMKNDVIFGKGRRFRLPVCCTQIW